MLDSDVRCFPITRDPPVDRDGFFEQLPCGPIGTSPYKELGIQLDREGMLEGEAVDFGIVDGLFVCQ